jgi:hypothetical protein
MDIVVVAVFAGFFVLSVGFVLVCERLRRRGA